LKCLYGRSMCVHLCVLACGYGSDSDMSYVQKVDLAELLWGRGDRMGDMWVE